ncbi:hypothetical protein CCAX7_30220 [Capsulimonas corticalis]|uniref:Uncharacterized protein n=1 Tax=Capsulimonas corticalis TaxID=2219043 RepID=A0A402CST0_9BACT|nr:hypothetical protein [Capsulimonas corticalis]BDI30971.1 hypothetical protein CCAX7_30220 [Capsulimonas corticalis]
MTKFVIGLGLSVMALGAAGSRQTDAAPILASYSHDASASSSTFSGDYRRVRAGSPRTGYHWAYVERSDQATSASGVAPLNGSTGTQLSTGTFFAPVYSGSGISSNTFSDTDTLAVLHVQVNAATTLTTPPTGYQAVNVSARASDSFVFTLDTDTDVQLTVSGTPGQAVRLIDLASNESIFAGSTGGFHDTLSAGEYEVVGTVWINATQNTLFGTMVDLGQTSYSLDYTLKVSPPT